MAPAIPPFIRAIPLPETLLEKIRTADRRPCSAPVLLDFSAMESAGPDAVVPAQWLSVQEEERFCGFTLKKRQNEWFAGRICAKIALQDFLRCHCPGRTIPAFPSIMICNSADGRPFAALRCGEAWPQAPDVSISHSGCLALALAAETGCGVDIQKTSDTLIRVKERFCTEQEERLLSGMQGNGLLQGLALLWAAKEAAKKALSAAGMPGFTDLVLRAIDRTDGPESFFIFERIRHNQIPGEKIRVITAFHQTSALGICIP